MKFTLIAALSVLSTLVSGSALPDLTRRGTVIRPAIGIMIEEKFPDYDFPPINAVEVSRTNGADNVRSLLGFVVPACTGTCTFSFSDASTATGSGQINLFTLGWYPVFGNTWNSKPFTNIQLGTFQASTTGSGPATVVQNFGLTFVCPTTTTNLGYEVQPVNDNDFVLWDITNGGLILTCG
ncbi:hypothetical protein B9Z19DRAFT_652836 [Tuber borchii]|uniref:Uncharacterized protein n=1 Tax=Tuber borchii TaxID=42251 RepID=A0A2T7A054_TUBBO|nr:hypothetical protein B9Z19DRAFT_652836 [Tuber borchii]